jgi:hypothetical protein
MMTKRPPHVRFKSSLQPYICNRAHSNLFFYNLFHTVIKLLSSTDENSFDLDSVVWVLISGLKLLREDIGPVRHVRLFHCVYDFPLLVIL